MTSSQSKKLIAQIALGYLGEHWKKKLTEAECGIWGKMIAGWNFDAARLAVENLFISYPPWHNDFNYRMPDKDILKKFYKNDISSHNKRCPCCSGSGWLSFPQEKRADLAVRCDCSSPEIDMGNYTFTTRTLSQTFPDNPEEKCDAFRCDPHKDSPCPGGSQYFNLKKIEWMNRIKANPAFHDGLKYLTKGSKLYELLNNIPF